MAQPTDVASTVEAAPHPKDNVGPTPSPPTPSPDVGMPTWVSVLAILVALGVGVAVVFVPGLVYTPPQKVVVFFLLALCPALLLADRASARFEMKLPGMVFTATGAAAILFGSLFALDHLAKPQQQIAVFEVLDDLRNPYPLDSSEFRLHPDHSTGLVPTRFIDGSTLVLMFPQQLPAVTVSLTDPLSRKTYRGTITYAGNLTSDLIVGKDLK